MYVPETEENIEKNFCKASRRGKSGPEEELKFKTAFYVIRCGGICKKWLGNAASLWL